MVSRTFQESYCKDKIIIIVNKLTERWYQGVEMEKKIQKVFRGLVRAL
jgi:hypothetical protein